MTNMVSFISIFCLLGFIAVLILAAISVFVVMGIFISLFGKNINLDDLEEENYD